jgi:hypothetical protein
VQLQQLLFRYTEFTIFILQGFFVVHLGAVVAEATGTGGAAAHADGVEEGASSRGFGALLLERRCF